MNALNQYELSRILRSKMVPMKRSSFGHFGLLETTIEGLQAREERSPDEEINTTFGYEMEKSQESASKNGNIS